MIRKKVKHIYFKSFIDNADIINTHNYFTSYSEFFIIKKLILMTFLIFFGFSSLAMSVSDIYFFIVILLKMRNNELFYQEDNKIYIFKK